MQATYKMRNRIKLTKTISTSVFIRPVVVPYQRLVTNIYANISFLYLLSSMPGIIITTSYHSDKEQACLRRKRRYFCYNKRSHIVYDCLRKIMIVAISESFYEKNSSQGKE